MAYYSSVQRYVDDAMRRYGPGTAYNDNAWASAAIAPYSSGSYNPFAVGPSQGRGFSVGTRPATNPARTTLPQPIGRTPSTGRGGGVWPGSPYPQQPAGGPMFGTRPQTPVTRTPTTPVRTPVNTPVRTPRPPVRPPGTGITTPRNPTVPRTPAEVVQSIVNSNPLNKTWGVGPGPNVMNNGNILNASPDLGLGPLMQFIQNIASNPSALNNSNQFNGTAPVAPPVVQPPVQNRPPVNNQPPVQQPPVNNRPPTNNQPPVQQPPAQQPPSGGGGGGSTPPATGGGTKAPTQSTYQKVYGMTKAEYMALYNQGIIPPRIDQ